MKTNGRGDSQLLAFPGRCHFQTGPHFQLVKGIGAASPSPVPMPLLSLKVTLGLFFDTRVRRLKRFPLKNNTFQVRRWYFDIYHSDRKKKKKKPVCMTF